MEAAADLNAEDSADVLAARIRQAREEAGLSRMALAVRLHAELGHGSPVTVRSWEAGKAQPRVDSLRALARITGKPITWFLDG